MLLPGEERFYLLVETEFSGEANRYGPIPLQTLRVPASVQDWLVID